MRCTGHISITNEVLRTLVDRCKQLAGEPICSSPILGSNLLQSHASYQHNGKHDELCLLMASRSLYTSDLVAAVDSKLWSHCMDSGQRMHFMRAKSESEWAAYQNAVQYIRERTEAFVRGATNVIARSIDFGHSPLGRQYANDWIRGDSVSGLSNYDRIRTPILPPMNFPTSIETPKTLFFDTTPLADALHSLQDSFSPAHVTRRSDRTITRIKCYAEQDKHQHDLQDIDSGTSQGSHDRSAAVSASVALIQMVLKAAVKKEGHLPGWHVFEHEWLAARPLSRESPPPSHSLNSFRGSRPNSELH